ncbi:type IV pilus modification PilV family protein [Robertmurraya andreesenii]|uniref:Prepilin-type N-terminal cleavage/methylation domain-containing protein n=1 Tax=Anoxybacillus andreesenii TaxID=1325932 RepID=A0ABT9V5B1_9BACL|nr:type II secretion system protein [Robertmurraya andreesenii]MDQ0156131.1 prepilin-type N-terminal cleavage/methylation domain-containing protein [Robertmurraya andreesenii]
MSISKILKNRRGLTLLEVLLSITILGIVVTSFLSFFNHAYSYTKKNEDKTVGINVARNVLNYFEQQDYGKIKDTYFSDSLSEDEVTITKASCEDQIPGKLEIFFHDRDACKKFFTPEINNVEFSPTVKFTRDLSSNGDKPDLRDQLIGVEVEVEWNKQTTSVRGLIKK